MSFSLNPVIWPIDGSAPRVDQIMQGHHVTVIREKEKESMVDLRAHWDLYHSYGEAEYEVTYLMGIPKQEKAKIIAFMRQISATESLSKDKEVIEFATTKQLSEPELFRKLNQEEYKSAIEAGISQKTIKVILSHGFNEEELKTLNSCFKKRNIVHIDVMTLLFFDLYETLKTNNINKFIMEATEINIVEQIIHDFFILIATLCDGNKLPFLGIDLTKQKRKGETIESFALLEDWSTRIKGLEEVCNKILENPELPNESRFPIEKIQKILKFLQRLINHENRGTLIEYLNVGWLRWLMFPGEKWEKSKGEELVRNLNKLYQFLDEAYQSFTVTIQDTKKSESYMQSVLKILRGVQQKMVSQQLTCEEVLNCSKKFRTLLSTVDIEIEEGGHRVNRTSDKAAAMFAKKQKMKPLEWREKQLLIYSTSQEIYHFINDAYSQLEQDVFSEILDSTSYLTRINICSRIKLSIHYIRQELQISPNNLDNLMLPYPINEEQMRKLMVIILLIRGKVKLWMMYMREELEKYKAEVDIVSQPAIYSRGLKDYSDCLEKIEPCFNEILDGLIEFLEKETLIGIKDFLQTLDPQLLKSNRIEWVEFFKNVVYNEIKEFLLCLMLPKYVKESFQNYGIVDEGCMIDIRLIPFLNVQGIEEIIDEILIPLQSEDEIPAPIVSEIPAILETEKPKEELSLSVLTETTEPKLGVQSVPLARKNKSKEKRQKGAAASASSNPILNPGKQPKDERIFHAGDTIRWVLRKLKEEGFFIEQVRGQTTGSHGIRIKDSEEGTPTTLVVGGSHKEIGSGTAINLNHLVAEKKSSSD